MEKNYRYYKIPSSKEFYRVRLNTVLQNNIYKLQALRYGVAVVIVVSKEKLVKNT